jgi:hypothetical protein
MPYNASSHAFFLHQTIFEKKNIVSKLHETASQEDPKNLPHIIGFELTSPCAR